MSIGPTGITSTIKGRASIRLQQSLLSEDGVFFDEESGRYVGLEALLDAYVEAGPDAIVEFQRALK